MSSAEQIVTETAVPEKEWYARFFIYDETGLDDWLSITIGSAIISAVDEDQAQRKANRYKKQFVGTLLDKDEPKSALSLIDLQASVMSLGTHLMRERKNGEKLANVAAKEAKAAEVKTKKAKETLPLKTLDAHVGH